MTGATAAARAISAQKERAAEVISLQEVHLRSAASSAPAGPERNK
jgi:hypothetical protein